MVLVPEGDLPGERSRAKYRQTLDRLAQLDKSDLDVALRTILAADAAVLGVGRVGFWELTPDSSAIRCRLLYDAASQTFSTGGELRARDFPAYFEAMLATRTIVAHDACTDPRTCEFAEVYCAPHDIRSMLDVPVWSRGRLSGVLCHEQLAHPRIWRSADEDFAISIANLVSVAVEAGGRRRAEEGYALLARATNDVVWDWDLTRDTLQWNEALERVFGHPLATVPASCDWWRDNIHRDDAPRVLSTINAALQSQASWTEQYRWRRGDGSYAIIIDRGHIVRDEHGNALRMVGSMLDLTERMALQARVELSDRLASLGQLAAGVAHEINNPLTYVMANVASLLETATSGSPELALLREAQEGAERIRRIVRDLQMFSRPREDDLENFDVNAVIESSINMAWNEMRHRAELIKELTPTPCVRMNRARLGQVVLNLLVNAAHAIPEGNAHEHRISVSSGTSASGEAVIEVRDTGCGITDHVKRRIFEPFFTTKPPGVGSGLGLSICHSIVTSAGGHIEIESPPGGGSLLRVTLPAAHGVCTDAPRPSAAPGPRQRVLLVDDEPAIRRALRRILESQHDVSDVAGAEAALQRITHGEHFDLVVCDLMMPGMTGMELHARLRAAGSPLAHRMIFMTGGAFSPASRDFVETCEQPVLEKPLTRAQVNAAIAELSARYAP